MATESSNPNAMNEAAAEWEPNEEGEVVPNPAPARGSHPGAVRVLIAQRCLPHGRRASLPVYAAVTFSQMSGPPSMSMSTPMMCMHITALATSR